MATEGAKACLKFAKRRLRLAEVYSFTAVINKRSENVMKKIGMKKLGGFDHPKVPDGSSLKRHVLYHITL
jgi:ribosomal-protein-alanine N-acetyltransferase